MNQHHPPCGCQQPDSGCREPYDMHPKKPMPCLDTPMEKTCCHDKPKHDCCDPCCEKSRHDCCDPCHDKPKHDCCDPCHEKPKHDCCDPCHDKPKHDCCDPCYDRPVCPEKPSCNRPKPCRVPRMPKPQDKQQGVLLNKILCCDRRFIPNLCTELCLRDLPRCARPPFMLMMVQQSGAQPWWVPLENKGPRLCLKVSIPVCCQVRDACGECYHATGVVEVDATLAPQCPPAECWRNSILIVPCVRLCAPPVCSEDACFRVQLEVSLELYMTRPEPCLMRAPKPPCPDLPLYPPPCPPPTPPCWPQCQEGPAPYGWRERD